MSIDEKRLENHEQEINKLALLINGTVQELKYVVALLKETRNNMVLAQNDRIKLRNELTKIESDYEHLDCIQHEARTDIIELDIKNNIKKDLKDLEKTKANRTDVNVLKWLVGAAALIGLVLSIVSQVPK